ncbi:histidine kinase N-terminal 7TM domain-containing protein [Chloroflexus sp.]|uniref:histidine kinase N-terminal 7TM domain-containing protein n=1 Tax=Chloroflexus sp. TaxID=1904827 RepID=UPI00261CE009|nr:histidine kinase N-terminal 7TM domain-containing protein [uncultured Chloroflexus sp.]
MLTIEILVGSLIVVCLVAAGVAIYLWPRRTVPSGAEFILMLVSITVWAGADAIELLVTTLEAKVFWRLAQQVGIVVLPPGWLLFAVSYLDFQPWSRSRARWLLFALPATTLLLALTNDWHHLFFQELRLSQPPNSQLEIVPGRWFWVHIGYSYICLTVGLALIVGAFWQASPLFRRQALLIGAGFLFPFLSNGAFLSQVTALGIDFTPISFLLSAPFIIAGLYRHQFLNLVPVARDRVIEAMADAMIVTDRQDRIVDFNPAAQRLFGRLLERNRLLSDTLKWPALLSALQIAQSQRIELNCPEHPERFFDITLDLIFDRSGRSSGRILVFREITERKQAERQLQEALRRFTDIIEQTPLVAIQRFDRNGIVLEWNRVCEQFYGYTAAEACGRRIQDLILSGDEVVEFEHELEQIWTTGQALPPRAWQIHTKTGEQRWLYSAMFPLFMRGQVTDVVCMDVDITDIRRAEENLRRQHDQLAALHRLTFDWLNRREMKDLLQAITDSAYRLLNVSYTELLMAEGEHTLVVRACTPSLPDHLLRSETPASAPLSWRAFQTRQPAIVLNYTQWPDHPPDYAQLNFGPAMVLPIVVGDECLGVLGMARDQDGAPFTPDEIQHAMLLTQLAALVLDNSNLYTAAQREIAERKLAEQQQAKLQQQLLQAQKMEAIGQLAGGIAHDFNNILTVITGNVELAMLEIEPDHPIHAELELIRQSAARASELVRQLLTFARRQPGQPRPIDVNRQINDTMNMMRRLIGEHIRLRLELSEPIDQVMIDPHQFEQVLINLVVNARDAMPDGGDLIIRTAMTYLSASEIPSFSKAQAGKYVLLSVCDTGIGIDAAILPHLFEPYFTTKPIGKGSGLGLAICDGIVTQHGGFFAVESQPNAGSCFTVALPAIAREAIPLDDEQPTVAQNVDYTGHETILLVEDEPEVRQSAARLLREQGYTVLEATHAQEAIDLALSYGDDLRLLISDVVLPHTDGISLGRQLQQLLPHVRVILMSGYVQRILANGDESPYPILSKPFTRYQLLGAIRKVINQPLPNSNER